MPFDIEFGCSKLVNLIVCSKTAEELEEEGFSNLPESRRLQYINQLMDLGWIREQKSELSSDYTIFAFSEKGRKIFENPAELLNLSDNEHEHITLLRRLDSLEREGAVSMMPQTILGLANICFGSGRFDSALLYAMKLLSIGEEMHSVFFMAEARLTISQIEGARGNADTALQSALEARELFRKIGEVSREADALKNSGWIIFKNGNYEKSREYYLEAKELYTSVRNMQGVAKCNINLATLSFIEGDFRKAEEYNKYALDFFHALGDRETEGKVLNNFGTMFAEMERYQDASEYFKKAVLTSRNAKNKYSECIAALNYAFSQIKLGNLEVAKQAVETVSKYVKDGFDSYLMAQHDLVLGIYSSRRDRWQVAEHLFLSAIRYANSTGNPSLIAQCHAEYGKALIERHEEEKAEEHTKISEEIVSTLYRSKIGKGFPTT